MIARQYDFVQVGLVFFTTLLFAYQLLRERLSKWAGTGRLISGALAGYVGGILAAFSAEFMLRGPDIWVRDYPFSNLYFFPTIMLGWLFGAIAFVTAPYVLKNDQP